MGDAFSVPFILSCTLLRRVSLTGIIRNLTHRRRNGTMTPTGSEISNANLLGMREVVKTSSSLLRRRNSGRFAVVAETLV